MQSVLQSPFTALALNKFLHDLQFHAATCLKSTIIVKNEAHIGEHEFIINAVLASLASCSEVRQRSTIVTNKNGWLKLNLDGGEIRLADNNVGPRTTSFPHQMTLSVVSQTLCRMLVFPAFALPTIRTRNFISGIR